MSLVSLKTARLIAARQSRSHQQAAVLHQIYRCYSTPRNPEQAEKEAATVRGNRAARERLESHQRSLNKGKDDYHNGTKFEGGTFAGEI